MDISLEQAIHVLGQSSRVVVAGHSDPDGDALGSMLGLHHMLANLGKQTWLYREGLLPVDYAFLPGADRVGGHLPAADWADLLVLLDCHQVERAGQKLADWLPDNIKVLVLDHHLGEVDERYLVHKDPAYSATAELITLMLYQSNWHVSLEVVMCLYAGIIADTGNFTLGNTTARVLNSAGWLVEKGARPEDLSLRTNSTRLNRLQLHGLAMLRTQGFHGDKIFVTRVGLRDLADFNCTMADLEGMLEPLRFIAEGLIVALLKELANNQVKVSIRSRRHVDVSGLARSFGGGGHKNAAGFKVNGTLDSVQAKFLQRAAQLVEKIGG